ncbi:MAG: hypothetical protein ABIY55_00080 [Kofleriaceae bacterium]
MKLTVAFLLLTVSACVTQPEVEPVEATQQVVASTDVAVSQTYVMGKYDAEDVWPTNQGISSVQVIYKRGPVRSLGPTYFAFIIWNGNRVGKIYCAYLGSSGADLRRNISDTTATRTVNVSTFTASSTGSGGGGHTIPTPHPNVDGEFVFPQTYLNNLKLTAQAIIDTTSDVMTYPELPTPVGG